MQKEPNRILSEVNKVLLGKEDVTRRALAAFLAGGHILLNDVPGVGKTTLAVAFSRALGLRYRRIQFTPDVLPSDIVGFTLYDRESGSFRYRPGALSGAQLVLGDEVNRTSAKTQSALLEAMEEGRVTVDGETHPLAAPFCVIATQNEVGAAGTQPLPQAELDRFLVELTIGYPGPEREVEMLRTHAAANPLDSVETVSSAEALLRMQREVSGVHMADTLLEYLVRLAAASRERETLALGLSPRGTLAVSRMARAWAWLEGRTFVLPEDVLAVFADVAAHRLLLTGKARLEGRTGRTEAAALLEAVPLPHRLK